MNLDVLKKDRLLEILAALPDGDTLCHGDFHPNNIICGDVGYYIIDWVDVSNGCPAADVCRAYLLFSLYWPEAAELYLNAYCSKSKLRREEVLKWLPVVAAARLSENFAAETDRITGWLGSI
jgi:Ser/Thr protein kinase RdoA (MazF antagonist)